MKQLLFALRPHFVTLFMFALLLSGMVAKPLAALAADSIEFNIGDEAIEQELPGTANADLENPGNGFGRLIGNLASVTMTIAAVMVFMYLLWGAVEWISAGGDAGKIEKARTKITQSIVGIIVLSSTIALFMMLQQFLGICVLPFFGGCATDAGSPVTPGGPGGKFPPVPI